MLDTTLHPGLAAIAERCDIVNVTKDSDEPAWHALRAGGIGSSNAGAILGLSPYESPTSVWAEKLGYLPPKDLSDNDAVFFGIEMEEPIAKWYAKKTGFQVINPESTFILRSAPVLRTNPDRLVITPDGKLGLVEVKTADAHLTADWTDGQSPPWYQAQAAQQRAVLGPAIDFVQLVCVVGGNRPVIVTLNLTNDYVEALADHLLSWWGTYVVPKVQPPADGMKATTDALPFIYPHDGSTLAAGPELLELTVGYEQAHLAMKAAEEVKATWGNRIRSAMGKASVATYGGKKICTWAESETDRFDTSEHAFRQPTCHATYRDISSGRTLNIARTKEARALREEYAATMEKTS